MLFPEFKKVLGKKYFGFFFAIGTGCYPRLNSLKFYLLIF